MAEHKKTTKKTNKKTITEVKVKAKPKKARKKPVPKKKPSVFSRIWAFFKKLFGFSTKKDKVRKKSLKDSLKISALKLGRAQENPIMSPGVYGWESQAVFNPAAIKIGGRVHLFYRAMGGDGVSRIGYASSPDGINFDVRLTHPVYVARTYDESKKHFPHTSPSRMTYDIYRNPSGGGWGGCEDPRAVSIEGIVYLTFNIFNGWHSMSVAVTAIAESDLLEQKWKWNNFTYLSKPDGRQKNWVLFPEKIGGKFALFYNLDKGDPDRVHIKFMNDLNIEEAPTDEEAPDPQLLPDHEVTWHNRTRSAAAPPIKTKDGWLLLYHAMDTNDPGKYKVGAMLLDLNDPTKVLYRAQRPILAPDQWYENDWKPGIVYASGAVVKGGDLFVYYGGGDKYIGMASIKIAELLKGLREHSGVKLTKRKKFLKIF